MKARRMPYRKQFTGSPWQQGGPAFGMNQMGGGMGGSGFDGFGGGGPMGMGGMDNQFAMGMMSSGFGRNQGYGGYGGMSPMGMNMGYGMGNMSRMKDRRGNQQNFRNQRKRPLQSRSPVGGQRNKRANYDMSANQRNRMRRRSRNNKMGGRNNYGRQARNSSVGRRRRPEGQRGKDDEDKDSESVDGELYNPAEPTDDFSEYEYEDGDDVDEEQEGEKEKDADDSSEKPKSEEKAEKAEGDEEGKTETEGKSEEKGEDADKEKAKNGIQVTIQQGAKGRSVSQEKKAGAARKSLVCHVCKIVCSTQEKFRNHMNGRGHKEKMETLLVLQREKAQALEARMKASHHMRTDSSKGSGKGKKNQNWCTVCECAFVGNFLSHRRTKEHRRKRDKKYPKCRPCRMGFSNADEYKEHCTSEEHKKKASQFHSTFRSQESDDDYVIVDATGIFEDEDRKKHQDEKSAHAISEQLKDLMQVEPAEEDASPEKTEETEKTAEENKSEETAEEKPVATSAVLLVNGYYCKLCYKFFGGGVSAKVEHCKSKRHMDSYKRSLPRPKKEPSSEKDKAKEGDQAKGDEDKTEEDKDKEESGESKVATDEKSDEAKVAPEKDGTSDEADSRQPELKEDSSGNVEAMETADDAEEPKVEATDDVEIVQETVEKEKTEADVTMEADEKDQSYVSAKDEEEVEKEDDVETTEKSSPGVRRGRSARARGRKRT